MFPLLNIPSSLPAEEERARRPRTLDVSSSFGALEPDGDLGRGGRRCSRLSLLVCCAPMPAFGKKKEGGGGGEIDDSSIFSTLGWSGRTLVEKREEALAAVSVNYAIGCRVRYQRKRKVERLRARGALAPTCRIR